MALGGKARADRKNMKKNNFTYGIFDDLIKYPLSKQFFTGSIMSENPKSSLFRIEALKAKSSSGLGSIRLAQPISNAVVSVIALGIAVAIVLFTTLSSYTKKAHVAGITVPKSGIVLVTAINAGRISSVLVHEGQHVKPG